MRRPSIRTLVNEVGDLPRSPTLFGIRFSSRWVVVPKWFVGEVLTWTHWLVTTELLPSWNRILRYVKTPLSVLLVSSLIFSLCGWLVAPQIYLLFAATTCVIAVGMVYPWIAIYAVDCHIDFPINRVVEGSVIRPRLVVHNRWPIPVWGLAVERGFESWEDSESLSDSVAVALAHAPAWSRTEFTWGVTPLRRGVYPSRKPVVASAFPFGLWTARRNVRTDATAVAWPLPINVDPPHHSNNQQCVPHVDISTSVTGDDSDIIGVRPYQSGDVMRNVHWTATARMNDLMVKERQRDSESRTRIVLIVQPRAIVSRLGDLDASLDWAVRIVVGLCEGYFRAQMPVTLHLGKRRFDVRSSRKRRMAMDALSVITLEDLQVNLRGPQLSWTDDSQVTISLDTNDDPAGLATHPFVIEMASQVSGRSMYSRVETLNAVPQRIEDFYHECDRLSLTLNRRKFQQGQQATSGSSHVH